MFATVAVVGFQTLAKVDFHDHRNVVIVATSVGLAMYVTAQPQVAQAVPDWAEIIFGSGITLGSLTAIGLNILFHHVGKDFGPAVAGQPGDSVRLDQVNKMSRDEFVETFAGLFQGPRWAVERAWDMRPFADTHALRRSFQEALFSGSHEEQRQLIEAYPQLGSQFVADGLSGEASLRDQSARGLTFLADPTATSWPRSPRRTASGSVSRWSSRSGTRSPSAGSSSRAANGWTTARTRSTPPHCWRSRRSPVTGSTTSSPTPTRSTAHEPVGAATDDDQHCVHPLEGERRGHRDRRRARPHHRAGLAAGPWPDRSQGGLRRGRVRRLLGARRPAGDRHARPSGQR